MPKRFADKKHKLQIALLQDFKCSLCKKSLGKYFEVDHIVPFSQGGKTTIENLQGVCKPCHIQKSKVDGSVQKRSN